MSHGGMAPISSSTSGWKAYMPAFVRSETGFSGFSVNPVTRPASSSSMTPPAEGIRRVEHRQGRDRAVLPVAVDEQPQVEVREVVGVAGQEEVFALAPTPGWPCSVPALPSSSGSKTVRTAGGPVRAAR